MTKSRGIRSPRRRWADDEIQFLRDWYPHVATALLAEQLGCPQYQIYFKARWLGIAKTPEYLDSPDACRLRRGDEVGKAYQFPKGHAPANKGTRRPGFAVGRMAETQFKKGRPAHEARNYVPIGTEKVDPKRKALMRKITDDPTIFPVKRWRPVHVLVWEAHHGPAPAGHLVIFRRGMKTFVAEEITVDRLELVSRAENMRRNTVHNLPKELAQLVQLRGALNRQINRLSKDRDGESKDHR